MRRIDRYVLHEKIASGGMASVYLGQMVEENGLLRTVAIKRLHPHVVEMTGAHAMFMDEARLSARVRHPNIVATLAAAQHGHELLLVMEYVHGVSLSFLESRAREAEARMPLPIVSTILVNVLEGLQAAHDATDEGGEPLFIVHRDVSPQNVIVGEDGRSRVLDFGIAKAAVRLQTTREGRVKGKLRYMAPEQVLNDAVSSRTDVYGAAVVLWELLTGQRLFDAASEGAIVAKVLEGVVIAPSRFAREVRPELEAIVLRGLSRNPEERFPSCGEMASALRAVLPPAEQHVVAEYVREHAGHLLRDRAALIAQIEGAGPDGSLRAVASPVVNEAAGTLTVHAPRAQTPLFEPTPVARKPKRGRTVAIASAAVLGMAGLSTFALRARTVSPEPSPPAPSVASAAASAPVLVASSAHAAPPEPAPPPLAPDAEAPKAKAVRPPPSASAPPRVRPSASASAPPRPDKSENCDPMFIVGADGIRRVKPECL
ncbi:serine/threonine protein kinase [Pendulispora brunnea]|uniref:Serine/threonine protein kinase n=1 Tax=Pendulispora brunnea TaxID=2905690 RepID=A0ABZ2K8N7_9BACT